MGVLIIHYYIISGNVFLTTEDYTISGIVSIIRDFTLSGNDFL
jgi:hypothetical protein